MWQVGKCFYGVSDKVFSDNEEEECDEDREDDTDDELDDEDNDEIHACAEIVTDIVKNYRIGSVIALQAPPEVRECFYLVVVNELKVAEKDIYDVYNHHVWKGATYFSCNYLKIVEERVKYVKYKKLSSTVFVHPAQVLQTYVTISDNFVLDMDEKQWLDDST